MKHHEFGSRERVEFWLLLVAWWAVIIATSALLSARLGGGLSFGLLLTLGLLLLAPLAVLSRWQRQRQHGLLRSALESYGLRLLDHPTDAERSRVLEEFAWLARLRNNADDVTWIARSIDEGQRCTILRHSFVDGYGDTSYDRTSTVVVVSSGDAMQYVWITRADANGVVPNSAGVVMRDVTTGDAWFDEYFRIQCTEHSAISRLLHHQVRQFFAEGSPKETWTLGYGYVICAFAGDAAPDGIRTILSRTMELRRLLAAV